MKKLLLLLAFISVLISCKKEPTADFSYTGTLLAGDLITFNNLSSHADTYTWDFGDGNTSTLEAPRNIFSKPGIYLISLTAKGNGKTVTKSKTLTITGTTYSLKNNTSLILYSFASFYYDGSSILDFVFHGSLEVGSSTEPVRTDRSEIMFGFSFEENGDIYIGVDPFILTPGVHNDFTISASTQIYGGASKSATFQITENLKDMLFRFKKIVRK